MKQRFVVGNWKMNGSRAMAASFVAETLKSHALPHRSVVAVICPPFPLLYEMAAMLRDAPLALGAQNCHAEREGAYTGEISAPMLQEAGCQYVILGHSERRAHGHETDAEIARKVASALAAELTPIICVGESLAEREAGRAEEVAVRQLLHSLPEVGQQSIIVAYEPVWAIGTGLTPTADDIIAMHAVLANTLERERGITAAQCPILYGGSVKPANAGEILDLPHVGGVLVGGASLNAESFCAMVLAAHAPM